MKQYTLSPKGRECVTMGSSLMLKVLYSMEPEWAGDTIGSFTIEELGEILPFTPEEIEQMLKELSEGGYINYVEFKP